MFWYIHTYKQGIGVCTTYQPKKTYPTNVLRQKIVCVSSRDTILDIGSAKKPSWTFKTLEEPKNDF